MILFWVYRKVLTSVYTSLTLILYIHIANYALAICTLSGGHVREVFPHGLQPGAVREHVSDVACAQPDTAAQHRHTSHIRPVSF